MALTASLATQFEKTAQTMRKILPKETQFEQYGRARNRNGGSTIQARSIIELGHDSRDMSFVRVRSHLFSALRVD